MLRTIDNIVQLKRANPDLVMLAERVALENSVVGTVFWSTHLRVDAKPNLLLRFLMSFIQMQSSRRISGEQRIGSWR